MDHLQSRDNAPSHSLNRYFAEQTSSECISSHRVQPVITVSNRAKSKSEGRLTKLMLVKPSVLKCGVWLRRNQPSRLSRHEPEPVVLGKTAWFLKRTFFNMD